MPMLMLLTVLRTPFFSQIHVPEETFLATHQKHLNLKKISTGFGSDPTYRESIPELSFWSHLIMNFDSY